MPDLNPVIFVALLGSGIHIVLTVAIFRSANDSGMNGMFWAVFYFLTLPVGLAAFFIWRMMAGATGYGASMNAADPSRNREIDARRDFSRPKTKMDFLPRPSRSFDDRKLKEFVCLGEWDDAMAHIHSKLVELRTQNRPVLEDDYKRMMLWVTEEENPYQLL